MTTTGIDPDPEDDFMKASAEEWSKDPEPVPAPPLPSTPTDRWGAPTRSADNDDGNRWGAEKLDKSDSPQIKDLFPKKPEGDKKKFPWWIIILAVVLVCLVCVVLTAILIPRFF